MGHAEAYDDPGTPEEQSRRTFMANATTALGGVIGLALAIPLVTSLVPPQDAAEGAWSPLTAEEYAALEKATEVPIKVTFNLHTTDGYLPAADEEQFFWAIKATDEQMQKERPELFAAGDKLPYPVANLGFAVFSPICPHLGCRYSWIDEQKKFVCPCHGSVYTNFGEHLAGPAPRGLDPLPLRKDNNSVEVTWIEYKQGTPDHIVLKIG
jgi:menaquinol-cytochrome c reductase iron-sulfur subunit